MITRNDDVQDLASEDAQLVPASGIDEAKVHLRRNGLALMEGVFSSAEVAGIRQALADVTETDRAAGVRLQGFAVDRDALNTRVVMLAAKHPKFLELAEHPLALALADEMLGERMQLSSFTANITAPGSASMPMHCDQGYMPSPWPSFAIGINVAYALDDFTVENGATLYVPGSHRELHGPDPYADYPQARSIECPAGSVFVMDDRVWHQTGANSTRDQTRIGLFAKYTRSYINPQETVRLAMSPEMQAGLSPSLRKLLGLEGHPARLILDVHRGA